MGYAQLAENRQQVPRCLLVEDSDFDQRRIKRILARAIPVDLEIAGTLREARDLLGHGHFDLILLDNALPDGLGVDHANELRSTGNHRDVPILLISDFPSPFIYDKAATARIAQVMGKDDFQPQHVREALTHAGVIARSRR